MGTKTTRRTFLKTAAAGVAGPFIFPRLSLAAPPSSRLQHAAIGVLGMGRSDLSSIYRSNKVDVVALCDVDANALAEAAESFPKARLYRDWREMLEEEEDRIDSVNVSTPDHMHAPIAMTAIRKGKHVYCQKPLTHEVYEARKLTRAARRKEVVTQMGIQIHAHDAYRSAVVLLQKGVIGNVKEWYSWSGASNTNETGNRPPGADPVPEHVDWDLWIGVAPERPYKEKEYHPFEWRKWRDFGSGATGDFGCHILDPVFTALDIPAPLTVTARIDRFSEEVWPGWAIIEYEFPGTKLTAGKTIRATWSDGGKKPDTGRSPHLPKDHKLPDSGSMLIGESGTMVLPHWDTPQLYPVDRFKRYPFPKLEGKNHYHEWVDACLGIGATEAGFDFAGPLTEAVQLGNVATRFVGQTLEWNAKRLRFTNNRDANNHLRRKYRDGWKVRGL